MAADYVKAGELLAASGIFNTPAELHGIISGQLSAGARAVDIEVVAQLMQLPQLPSGIIVELISRFQQDIAAHLQSMDFGFQPLLPDDDEELVFRLEALGRWCDGFNMGFAASGLQDKSILEETREVLHDFARIAELDESNSDGEDQEQNEEDYTEIVEYVRMAATSVYMQNGVLETESRDTDGINRH
ncbi:MAG: UPF0149 family protein [Pseudomonadales bacterium]|nr:UPF0149 family protein [Pseudomonadales bacterium]